MSSSFLVRMDDIPELARLLAVELAREPMKNSPTTTDALVDRVKLAELLSVSVPTIDRLVRSEAIPSTMIGKRRLFNVEQVGKALDANKLNVKK